MTTAFQGNAFQFTPLSFQIDAGTIVWPAPEYVALGVQYGPNGNDFTGTLVITAGGSVWMRCR